MIMLRRHCGICKVLCAQVTNYHVLGSAFGRFGTQRQDSKPQKVARIALLGTPRHGPADALISPRACPS